jgi:aminopeptidase N
MRPDQPHPSKEPCSIVPGTNLTRDEAAERAGLVSVSSYEVELDLTVGSESFGSTSLVRFTAEPGSATFADLVTEGPIHEITLNGRPLDPAAVFADSRIALDGLDAENTLRVHADCQYSHTGEGLHRMVDPVDGGVFLYTQFEVPDARRVFADFEQPDLKATFQFTVTAPAGWELFSNSPTPKPEPAGEGKAVWRFEPTQPISTYITALVAGDYGVVRKDYTSANGTVIPMAVAARKSLMEFLDADEIFDVTFKGFDYFEAKFDQPYPFPKYDQLFVPEYNAGAMENAGCVTFRESYVFRSKVTDAAYERRAETILHELAHMWFGDLVTMEWWNDLWLNESFATYASVRCQADATRWTHAWTTFANAEKTWAYAQDQLPSTHPIVAEIPDLEAVYVNFDGITYAKGASVLKQLVAYVGDEAFFRACAPTSSGTPGATRGCPTCSARSRRPAVATWPPGRRPGWRPPDRTPCGPSSPSPRTAATAPSRCCRRRPPTTRRCVRTGSPSACTRRARPGLTRVRRLELDVDGPRTEVPELVGVRQPDVVVLNDDDLSYTKIRFDERSIATLVESIGEFAESLPRALAWVATWDMVRNGELAASAYVEQVLSGAAKETEIGVLQSLQLQVKSAIELYAAPATGRGSPSAGPPSRTSSCSPPSRAATSSSPGRGRSALGALGRATWTCSPGCWRHRADRGPDGRHRPALDPARAAGRPRPRGRGGDRRRARQGPDGGGQAARARLPRGLPTAEAKEQAWASMVESDKLTNEELLAVIGGFKPERAARTARAVRRTKYFAASPGCGPSAPRTWRRCSSPASTRC